MVTFMSGTWLSRTFSGTRAQRVALARASELAGDFVTRDLSLYEQRLEKVAVATVCRNERHIGTRIAVRKRHGCIGTPDAKRHEKLAAVVQGDR